MLTTTTMAILTIQPINGNIVRTGIKLDEIQLIVNYTTILHVKGLTEIEQVIENIENNVERSELNKVKIKFHTIQINRGKRGLTNIIGPSLRWIAGTMDDEDKSEIEDHIK